ncbi:multidrug ABC transporter permease [Nitrosomonas sp. sh817]|uniref:multidrug ABC transporter permease n=1 Tax=Nitrosomonas sp. sh817 TaxID=3070658 RepID=UPI0027DAEA38|nr:multidrug ABC transporter permease [Nitrosomonas sp. sh817]WMJ07850.1 multidrug ABC transporter permease [Nitrosomonas sp. sh817]
MFQILKPIVSLLMFLTVLFFIHTMLTITTSFAPWLSVTVSSGCAGLAAWFAWMLIVGKKTGTLMAIAGGALLLGGLFFTVGFLGPMVVAKDTSQGPMIGIFIAAPLGVIVGAIGGYVYASREDREGKD